MSSRLRVALVNPPNTRTLGYVGENAAPPLGLCYIASTLRSAGFAVDLFDFADDTSLTEEQLGEAGFFHYDLFGFTAYTKTFPAAIDLLRVLRTRAPHAIVVFGGPHASPCAVELLRIYDEIDYVITNEGEKPMLELARHLSSGEGALDEIAGLVYRQPDHSRPGVEAATEPFFVSNPPSRELVDLDSLPVPARDFKSEPNRHVFQRRRHDDPARVAFVSSSRGCPKRCSFCSIVVLSPKYRTRSVSSLMAEIRTLYESQSFGHITFLDANFFVNVKRTVEFANALYDWNPQITWSGTATADLVSLHADVLADIATMNCSHLEVGIESGSPAVLARFNKRTTVDQNLRAIHLLHEAGLGIELDFIMFDPETSLTDLRLNLEFLRRADLIGHYPSEHLYNAMKLYPGTPARTRYVNRLALSEHHLMELIPPFEDTLVSAAYRILKRYFDTYQRRVDSALHTADNELRRLLVEATNRASSPAVAQELAAKSVRLRHLPYRLFEAVLDAIDEGLIAPSSTLEDTDCLATFVAIAEGTRATNTVLAQRSYQTNVA